MRCDVCFSSSSSGWREATCGLCSVICDRSQRRQHHTAMQLLVWAWAQLAKRGAGQVVLAVSCWGTGEGRAGGDRLPQSHLRGVQVGEKSNNEFVNPFECVWSLAAWLYLKLTNVCLLHCCQGSCVSQTGFPRRCCTCYDQSPVEWHRPLPLWSGGWTGGQERLSFSGVIWYIMSIYTCTSLCFDSRIVLEQKNHCL